jgi:hypothetical protein
LPSKTPPTFDWSRAKLSPTDWARLTSVEQAGV